MPIITYCYPPTQIWVITYYYLPSSETRLWKTVSLTETFQSQAEAEERFEKLEADGFDPELETQAS